MAETKATAKPVEKKAAAKPAAKKIPKEEIMQKHAQMV
jgi:hypothetical protein